MSPTSLDHRIPPPVVFLASAALAWLLRWLTPAWSFALPARAPLAIGWAVVGVVLGFLGMLVFRHAGTTIDPHAPNHTRALVQSGPYRISRNPMYLGLACVLIALCIHLANPLTFVAVAAFIAYLTRFQIQPEERVLLEKFGEPYARYLRTVRRWL